jgi:hypothetical protein
MIVRSVLACRDVPTDDALLELLAAPPGVPVDPDLFSSNSLLGEPGIYPQGTAMAPAVGPPTGESAAVAALTAVGVDDAATRLDEPALDAVRTRFGVVPVRA